MLHMEVLAGEIFISVVNNLGRGGPVEDLRAFATATKPHSPTSICFRISMGKKHALSI